MTLRQWMDAINEHLRTSAAALGVAPENITAGLRGPEGVSPPFVWTFIEPLPQKRDSGGRRTQARARVAIFCGVEPEASSWQAEANAMELAERVQQVLERWKNRGIRWIPDAIAFDGQYADSAAATLDFDILYDLAELL